MCPGRPLRRWQHGAVNPETLDHIERRRLALASEFEQLDLAAWATPSWCDGWSAHVVLAHLVDLAEAAMGPMLRDLVRSGFRLDPVLDRRARATATAAPDDLIARLRIAARGTFRAPGAPLEVLLGEVIVHGADSLGPLGREIDVPSEAVALVLPVYRRLGRLGFHARGINRVRMVATDLDWTAGSGPEVRGRAIDLLLVLANRGPALARLAGPGVDVLRAATR